MKHLCANCGMTFRRFREGKDRCPLCGFWYCCEEHQPGMAFSDVFYFRKWLRRKLKLIKWRIFGRKNDYCFSKPEFVGKIPPQDPFKYKVRKKPL